MMVSYSPRVSDQLGFGTRYQLLDSECQRWGVSSLRLSSHHWDQQGSNERLESTFQPRFGFHSPCSKFSHVSHVPQWFSICLPPDSPGSSGLFRTTPAFTASWSLVPRTDTSVWTPLAILFPGGSQGYTALCCRKRQNITSENSSSRNCLESLKLKTHQCHCVSV